MTLKEAITQAPIVCYPDSARRYMVYTDALDDACGAQLSQEHNGTKFPVAFLSHKFTESKEEMEYPRTGSLHSILCHHAYGNYHLQGTNITFHNDHKPLAKFMNGKRTNNKVNRWGLELATHNFTFEWISEQETKLLTTSPDWLPHQLIARLP